MGPVRKAVVLAVPLMAVVVGWMAWRFGVAWPTRLGGRAARNLLLVSLDTLRSDRLGCYGYAPAQTPRLDALAARGARFAQATTVTPLTLPAHSSLLTGTFPAHHGVRDNGGFYLQDEETTLAETLHAAGYRTGGFVGAFVLDSRGGIAQGFDRYFDDFDLTRFDQAPGMDAIQRPGREVVDEALRWLAEKSDRPFFGWVHLYDPHAPYEAPEPFRSQFPATASGAYDAEVAATDAQVGRLLDFLQLSGRDEDTVVMVVADHGEMLGEHGEPTHGFFIYEGAVHVPLIVAGPGVVARTVAEQVRIVDVMPTALELLGLKVPASVQGASLLPLLRGEPLALVAQSETYYPRYHYGWSELVSVQDGRFKLIRATRRELFDLQRDPVEQTDLAGSEAARAANLEASLDGLLKHVSRAGPPRGPTTVDAETEERLQALGYIGGSLSPRRLAEHPRGDPKDKIGLYNRLKLVASLSIEGRIDEALAEARRALAEDPDVVEAHLLLGNVLKKARRTEEALRAYRDALARDPDHQEALYSLGIAYKDLSRFDDALSGFEHLERLDPRNGKVLWQLADIWMRKGGFPEAEAVLKRALALDLDRPRFLLKLGECYLEQKRLDEAAQVLGEAVAARPTLETAHFNLGLVYEERGQPEQAIAAYEKELTANPKAHRAAFNLAKLLQQAGRPREALERFRQVATLAPDFAIGRLYLAKVLLDTGDLAGAEREAKAGLSLSPDPSMAPLGHYVLADAYNRQGRVAEARTQQQAGDRLARAGARASAGR